MFILLVIFILLLSLVIFLTIKKSVSKSLPLQGSNRFRLLLSVVIICAITIYLINYVGLRAVSRHNAEAAARSQLAGLNFGTGQLVRNQVIDAGCSADIDG